MKNKLALTLRIGLSGLALVASIYGLSYLDSSFGRLKGGKMENLPLPLISVEHIKLEKLIGPRTTFHDYTIGLSKDEVSKLAKGVTVVEPR